jgi:hypothetical protein
MPLQITQAFKIANGPRIEQNGKHGWYVVVTIEDGYREDYYLHNDLKWRKNTYHCGVYSGYFLTMLYAENALNKYFFDKAIIKSVGKLGWFVYIDSEEYLHTDGVWRTTTCNQDGVFSGYFESEESAKKAFKEQWGIKQ